MLLTEDSEQQGGEKATAVGSCCLCFSRVTYVKKVKCYFFLNKNAVLQSINPIHPIKSTVCATYQRDPKGHAPPFRKQQVPSSSPAAHLMSHLLARLVDQQDGDSTLWGSGSQPGPRHQYLTPHAVQFLWAEFVQWKHSASSYCVTVRNKCVTCSDILWSVTLSRTDFSHRWLWQQRSGTPRSISSLLFSSSTSETSTQSTETRRVPL